MRNSGASNAPDPDAKPRGRAARVNSSRRTAWNWARRIGLLVVAVVLIEYLAVPRLVETRSQLNLFIDASPWLLAIALALEIASLASYTSLTRAVLPPSARPPFLDQFRIDLVGLGASHVLPGSGATATALRYRLMVIRGVSATDAVSTTAVQTALSVIGLVTTFTAGIILALPGILSFPATSSQVPSALRSWEPPNS